MLYRSAIVIATLLSVGGCGDIQVQEVADGGPISCTTNAECDDGLSCTSGQCNGGTCVYVAASDRCFIDGACYSVGAVKSDDDCFECQPDESNLDWANVCNPPPDATGDTGSSDSGPGDTGSSDSGPGDTGSSDSGPGDAGSSDSGPGDADGGSGDAGTTCVDVDQDGYGDGCALGPDCDDGLDGGAQCHDSCALWFEDLEGDGYGDPDGATKTACVKPADHVENNDDCDPASAAHWSDCGSCEDDDGDDYGANCDLGDDCDDDPVTGADCTSGCQTLYPDADGDGYGDGGQDPTVACVAPAGQSWATNDDDCDDTPGTGAAHWSDCGSCVDDDGDDYGANCDLGSDCDDHPATGASCYTSCATFYIDNDQDLFGDAAVSACSQGPLMASAPGDCDDTDPDIHPGATDYPDDGKDQDCTDGPAMALAFGNAVFVSQQGFNGSCQETGPGSYDAPNCSLATGLSFVSEGGNVFVAQGNYQPVSITKSVQVYGGYSTDWDRDMSAFQTRVGPGFDLYGVQVSQGTVVILEGITAVGIQDGVHNLGDLTFVRGEAAGGGTSNTSAFLHEAGSLTIVESSAFGGSGQSTSMGIRTYASTTLRRSGIFAGLGPSTTGIFIDGGDLLMVNSGVSGGMTTVAPPAGVDATNVGIQAVSQATVTLLNSTVIAGATPPHVEMAHVRGVMIDQSQLTAVNTIVVADHGFGPMLPQALYTSNSPQSVELHGCLLWAPLLLNGQTEIAAVNACGFSECVAATANVSADPMLFDMLQLAIHAHPSSPAVDAGVDVDPSGAPWSTSPLGVGGVSAALSSDIHGDPRPQYDGPDIGADELGGVYVDQNDPNCDDASGTRVTPTCTLQAGYQLANPKDVIYVSKGDYVPPTFYKELIVMGGYDAAAGWSRDIEQNITRLDGSSLDGLRLSADATVEGFFIDNSSTAGWTYGVRIMGGYHVRLFRNTVFGGLGGGNGAGTVGVMCHSSARCDVFNNRIIGGQVPSSGGGSENGIYNEGELTALNNIIESGEGVPNISRGVYATPDSTTVLINNTIRGRDSLSTSNGAFIRGAATLVNNIVTAEAQTGTNENAVYVSSEGTLSLAANDLWGACAVNSGSCVDLAEVNACAFSGCIDSAGNIAELPLLTFDNHLLPLSPCVDAGINPSSYGFWMESYRDLDDEPRPQKSTWDIGADEVP